MFKLVIYLDDTNYGEGEYYVKFYHHFKGYSSKYI